MSNVEYKFLLDENITPRLKSYLIDKGYGCEHVNTELEKGTPDDQVFEYARINNFCLITHNGKDFVVMVIPKTNENHHGIVWSMSDITRQNYQIYFDKTIEFIKNRNDPNMKNKILKGNLKNSILDLKYSYPKSDLYSFQL